MRVHMIAACGVGMSALAALLKQAGHEVTGSDQAAYPPASTLLESLGVRVALGWDPAHLDGADLVVCGNAVRRTNPEAVAATERGLPMTSFPQAMEQIFLAGRRPLVVAGTHGKTTSSSMLAWVLTATGRAPGYLIGGAPLNLPSAAELGTGPEFVIEGDEYDSAYFDKEPKFLHYHPAHLLLTAIEFDHADIYADLAAVTRAFRRLVEGLSVDAGLIACSDFPVVREVVGARPACWFGVGRGAAWRVDDLDDDGRTTFTVRERGRAVVRMAIDAPGAINARNALGVLLVAHELGLGWSEAADALAEFRGVRRRQEVVADAGGITVIDDFAHHPTAVRLTLDAMRKRFPGRRVVAVFEPRSNTSRRAVFQDAYVEALSRASVAAVSAVYAKPNDPLTADQMLSTDRLVADLERRKTHAWSAEGPDAILERLPGDLRSGDVVVCMSNGSFGNLPRRLLALLAAGTGTRSAVQP
jgi:UDP-N-acetylmuramate: L-alanyl-gamma-D-glutamyl-meso-diaminopimelate ligase